MLAAGSPSDSLFAIVHTSMPVNRRSRSDLTMPPLPQLSVVLQSTLRSDSPLILHTSVMAWCSISSISETSRRCWLESRRATCTIVVHIACTITAWQRSRSHNPNMRGTKITTVKCSFKWHWTLCHFIQYVLYRNYSCTAGDLSYKWI